MLFLQTRTPSAAIAAWIAALVFVEIFSWCVPQFHLVAHPLGTPAVVLLVPIAPLLGHVWMGLGAPELLAIFAMVFVVARTVVL